MQPVSFKQRFWQLLTTQSLITILSLFFSEIWTFSNIVFCAYRYKTKSYACNGIPLSRAQTYLSNPKVVVYKSCKLVTRRYSQDSSHENSLRKSCTFATLRILKKLLLGQVSHGEPLRNVKKFQQPACKETRVHLVALHRPWSHKEDSTFRRNRPKLTTLISVVAWSRLCRKRGSKIRQHLPRCAHSPPKAILSLACTSLN